MSIDPAHLVLIRHAEIDCSRDGSQLLCGSHDAPLNPCGRIQVQRLKARLIGEPPPVAAYVSPLRRAVETAAALPEPLRPKLRLCNSLAEIHCGLVEGMAISQVQEEYANEWRRNLAQDDETFCWPGGETYARFRRRVIRAINALARMHPGRRVMLITHAGVVNQVLGSITGQSPARWENLRPGNTALTEVLWNGGTGEVIRFDDRSHLTDPAS